MTAPERWKNRPADEDDRAERYGHPFPWRFGQCSTLLRHVAKWGRIRPGLATQPLRSMLCPRCHRYINFIHATRRRRGAIQSVEPR